jgi:hypothetical protein
MSSSYAERKWSRVTHLAALKKKAMSLRNPRRQASIVSHVSIPVCSGLSRGRYRHWQDQAHLQAILDCSLVSFRLIDPQDTGLADYEMFLAVLGTDDSALAKKLFNALDEAQCGKINYRQVRQCAWHAVRHWWFVDGAGSSCDVPGR